MRRTFIIVAAGLLLAGCSSGNKATTTPPATTAPPSAVAGQEKEFAITLNSSNAKAGSVAFTVTNTGSVMHEFVVVKTDLAQDNLPLKNGDVDEDSSQITKIGEIEDIQAGKTESKSLTLPAGSYVIFCNVSGHYKAGMHTALTVPA